MKVYVLLYAYYEDWELVGVYSTLELAQAASPGQWKPEVATIRYKPRHPTWHAEKHMMIEEREVDA
jgi:hypothetical protein